MQMGGMARGIAYHFANYLRDEWRGGVVMWKGVGIASLVPKRRPILIIKYGDGTSLHAGRRDTNVGQPV
jgi:hypothetical protein